MVHYRSHIKVSFWLTEVSKFLDCLREVGQPPAEHGAPLTSEHSKLRQILRQKNVHLIAFFILVYVGVEVTIGGLCFPSSLLFLLI